MATCLSELKRHEKAIVHARIALKLLLLELFGEFSQLVAEEDQQTAPRTDEQIATGEAGSATATVERLRAQLPQERVAVLAIAYHNLGQVHTSPGRGLMFL
jgi:hypothetical protein